MKKISLSLVIFSLFFGYNVFAQQSWMEMMQDHNANLKDVQSAFNTWYASNKPADVQRLRFEGLLPRKREQSLG